MMEQVEPVTNKDETPQGKERDTQSTLYVIHTNMFDKREIADVSKRCQSERYVEICITASAIQIDRLLRQSSHVPF